MTLARRRKVAATSPLWSLFNKHKQPRARSRLFYKILLARSAHSSFQPRLLPLSMQTRAPPPPREFSLFPERLRLTSNSVCTRQSRTRTRVWERNLPGEKEHDKPSLTRKWAMTIWRGETGPKDPYHGGKMAAAALRGGKQIKRRTLCRGSDIFAFERFARGKLLKAL